MRSARRPCGTAITALPMMYAAATWPASLYEPISELTSNTMPSVIIDIGRRARIPAEENASAPRCVNALR